MVRAAEQTLKSVGPWSKISKPPVVVCFSAHRLRNCVTSLYHGLTMDPVLQHGAGAYRLSVSCVYCTVHVYVLYIMYIVYAAHSTH